MLISFLSHILIEKNRETNKIIKQKEEVVKAKLSQPNFQRNEFDVNKWLINQTCMSAECQLFLMNVLWFESNWN